MSNNGEKFDLKTLAIDWQSMFNDLLENKKTNPLVPYNPTANYRVSATESIVKLNIAAGPNVFVGDWINIDYEDFSQYFKFIENIQNSNGMPEHQRKLWSWCQEGHRINYQQHNMTKPFTQFNDDSVDFIYCGQAIEHISPMHQAPAFLKECHRMLKTGGILRLTTPDLNLLINAYINKQTDKFIDDQPSFYKEADPAMRLSLIMFGAGGEGCTQDHYEGHMCLYSQDSLTNVLKKAGFSQVFFYDKAGVSKNDKVIVEIRDEGISHSLICEAIK